MKQDCWPGGMTPSFLPRYKACWFHDKLYEKANIRNTLTRKTIDVLFLKQMLVEKPNNRKTAYIYYYIVRLLWWIRFYTITNITITPPMIKNKWMKKKCPKCKKMCTSSHKCKMK